MLDAVRWAALFVSLIALAACGGGGGDDDDDSDEDKEELDLAALVVAAFKEEPSRLPNGLTLTAIELNSHWGGQSLAVVEFPMSGPGGFGAHGTAVIFRNEEQAEDTLAEEAEGWEAEESTHSRGHFCFWSPFALELNADVEGANSCLGRAGNVYLEVEYGEVAEDDAEAAIDILLALEDHFEDLIDDATRKPRSVAGLPLAAMLASIQPPAPDGATNVQFLSISDELKNVGEGFLVSSTWQSGANEFVFFNTFESAESADADREAFYPTATERGRTVCQDPGTTDKRFCVHQAGDTMIVTSRAGAAASDPRVDKRMEAWADALAEYVTDLQEADIPRAPKVSPTQPSGSRTPTGPSALRTATPALVPTRTPLPPISRVNSGTWTLDLKVLTNTCPSGLPAVGSTIRVEYELTDESGEGYIVSGERVRVDEYLPRQISHGVVVATLPTLKFSTQVTNGTMVGYGEVVLGFVAEDETFVEYLELYDKCEITAE